MQCNTVSVSVRGQQVAVPCFPIEGRDVIIRGKWVKVAVIRGEEWMNGESVPDPERFLSEVRAKKLNADILTFSQKFTDPTPHHPFHHEWDNVAAIPITTFDAWWDSLSQEGRKNVRRAEKRGVVTKAAPFDDDFVKGIKGIYDETPIRQGREFWHYGKPLEIVRRDNSTYADRSEFIASYFEGKMIGFIKMVYVDQAARIMQILSCNGHFDKRPANALLAKAVEIAASKGMKHLTYCAYVYGPKKNSSITEFKRRNGFLEIRFPTYYIPLSAKGKAVMALKMHRGIKGLLPESVVNRLLDAREYVLETMMAKRRMARPSESST